MFKNKFKRTDTFENKTIIYDVIFTKKFHIQKNFLKTYCIFFVRVIKY